MTKLISPVLHVLLELLFPPLRAEFTDKAVFDVLPRATVSIGCKVDFPRNNVEKCGNIIAVSNDRATAIKAAEDAVSNTFITLKPCTKETDDYLAGVTQSDEESFPPDAFGKLTEEQLSMLEGTIAADTPVASELPDFLNTDEYQKIIDWNFNTIADTLRKFDILRAKHPSLDKKAFFKTLMRGGIQGAVYYSDTKVKASAVPEPAVPELSRRVEGKL